MNLLTFLSSVDCISDCGGAEILRIIKFIWILLDLVLFIVPIGLIIFVMIDFSKNVIASKEDDMKKNLNIAIKRIMYCAVLFLFPNIVKFAVNLVDSTTGNKAFGCIALAEEITKDELSLCEVNLHSTSSLNEAACYVCKDKSVYIWSNTKPNVGTDDCTSEYIKTARPKSLCEVQANSCWKCLDGGGYVLRGFQPGSGYVYTPETSFNYTTSICGPGFYPDPVDDSYCTGDVE